MATSNLADRYREQAAVPSTTTTELLPEPMQTDLVHWPPEAKLIPWIIPITSDSVFPWKQTAVHVSKMINGNEIVILIGFGDLMDWVVMKKQMAEAAKLGVAAMALNSSANPNCMSAVMFGIGEYDTSHGREAHYDERAVFSPSETLMRILGIGKGSVTRNSLVLIHQGQVKALWVATDKDGMKAHDWTDIHRAVELIHEDDLTETLEME